MNFQEMAEIYDRIDSGTATPEDLEIARLDDLDPNGYVQTLLASPFAGEIQPRQAVRRPATRRRSRLIELVIGTAIGVILLASCFYAGGALREASSVAEIADVKGQLEGLQKKTADQEERISELAEDRRLIQIEKGHAELDAQKWETRAQDSEYLFVSVNADPMPSGDEALVLSNISLPIKLTLNGESTVRVMEGTRTFQVETGRLLIDIQPTSHREFIQLYGVYVNGAYQGSTAGRVELDVRESDQLRLHLHEPTPPWNSVTSRIGGHVILLGQMAPDSRYKPPRPLEAGEFNNSIEGWASIGVDKIAEKIADAFIEQRDHGFPAGQFDLPLSKTRIVFPVDTDGIPRPPLNTIGREEFRDGVQVAIDQLLAKENLASGKTFRQTIREFGTIN